MNAIGGRRGVQVAVLTGALLVVLVFLGIDTMGKSQDTRAVWVLTRSAVAGAVLDNTSVRMERIPAPRDSYSFVTSSPVGKFTAHAMSPGDILRPDDIETSPQVAVPIKLTGYQGAPGDMIDIYAIDGGKATLVGRGITVLAGSTVQVPASDEPLWIALYGSSATLVGARSNGTGVPDGSAVSGADAARRLSVLAHGAAASPAP